MIKIPEEFISTIRQVVDWYSKAYMHDEYNKACLKRIASDLYNQIDGKIQIEEKFLLFIKESVSYAITNISECNIEKDILWKIHDWIYLQQKS